MADASAPMDCPEAGGMKPATELESEANGTGAAPESCGNGSNDVQRPNATSVKEAEVATSEGPPTKRARLLEGTKVGPDTEKNDVQAQVTKDENGGVQDEILVGRASGVKVHSKDETNVVVGVMEGVTEMSVTGELAPEVRSDGDKTPRFKKRKVAMFFAYCGEKYQGMQRNPGAVTIEGELEAALHRAGGISEDNFGDPRKVDWMRAARTDKGVSALGQVVSARIVIDPPGFVDRVNQELPSDIRMLGYKRVTNSFNAKQLCDRRRYEYVIPTFAFDPDAHRDRQFYFRTRVPEGEGQGPGPGGGPAGEEGGARSVPASESEEKVAVPEASGTESLNPGSEPSPTVAAEKAMSNGVAEEKGAVGAQTQVGEEEKEELKAASVKVEGSGAIGSEGLVEEEEAEGGIGEDGRGPCTGEAEVHPEGQKEAPCGSPTMANEPAVSNPGQEEAEPDVQSTPAAPTPKTPFVFSNEVKARLNKILDMYRGTHNFHNFTARVKAQDPSANRFMISFEANEVFEKDGIEFVRCQVVGQSFMLHQIRKMIGMAVAIMRGCAPESIITSAFRKDRDINVPMAPELGLFLDECLYPSYNRKFKNSHEEISLASFREQVAAFKRDVIYPHIAKVEGRDHTVQTWLHSLNDRNFPDFVKAWEEERGKVSATSVPSGEMAVSDASPLPSGEEDK